MDAQVIITGTGPTGLTLAIELVRCGIGVRVVDRATAHFVGSRGKGLQPRTQEVLFDLGVLDEVHAAGTGYPTLRRHVAGADPVDSEIYDRREPTAEVPYPNT